MTDLWRLTATEAVGNLRKRELSPLELVEAAAARIEAVEPKTNALPNRFFDEARDHAKRFERGIRDDLGWLAGLPIAVKDYNDVAGQLTTYGSPIFAENREPADDRTVATLRANGAIPLAKSNVPEFAGSHTFNPVWGIYTAKVKRRAIGLRSNIPAGPSCVNNYRCDDYRRHFLRPVAAVAAEHAHTVAIASTNKTESIVLALECLARAIRHGARWRRKARLDEAQFV
jgi:amidase